MLLERSRRYRANTNGREQILWRDSQIFLGGKKGGYLVWGMLFVFMNGFLSEWQNFRNEKDCLPHTLDPSEHGQAR